MCSSGRLTMLVGILRMLECFPGRLVSGQVFLISLVLGSPVGVRGAVV
ncbi:MAG: hypothetical protein ABSB86_15615 [Bryobacteraceae bacterium]